MFFIQCCTLVLIADLNTSYEPFLFFAGWTDNFEKIKHLLKIIVKKFVLY